MSFNYLHGDPFPYPHRGHSKRRWLNPTEHFPVHGCKMKSTAQLLFVCLFKENSWIILPFRSNFLIYSDFTYRKNSNINWLNSSNNMLIPSSLAKGLAFIILIVRLIFIDALKALFLTSSDAFPLLHSNHYGSRWHNLEIVDGLFYKISQLRDSITRMGNITDSIFFP